MPVVHIKDSIISIETSRGVERFEPLSPSELSQIVTDRAKPWPVLRFVVSSSPSSDRSMFRELYELMEREHGR